MEKQQIIEKIKELEVKSLEHNDEIEKMQLEVSNLDTQSRLKRDAILRSEDLATQTREELNKLRIALAIIER